MFGLAILVFSVGSALAGVSIRMPYLGTAGVTYNVPTQEVPFHQFGARISSVAYGNAAFLGRAYNAAPTVVAPAAYAVSPAVVPLAATRLAAAAVPVASTLHQVPAITQVPFTKLEHQPALVQSVVDVAKAKLATRKFEIRRPAIEKQFYDIEERVVVRPVGKAVVELDQPEAKSQKGPAVVQPAVHKVSAASPIAFAGRTYPAFVARSSLALPAFTRTAHIYSYPFQGPSYLQQHHTIALSSTSAPAPQQESEPELIKPDDPSNPQSENPIEPVNNEPQIQPQPAPYPPQQPDIQPQPFPPQQPDVQPQPFPPQQPVPQPQPQQDASDSDSESVSIENPEISARAQEPQSLAAPTQLPQIDEYNNLIARQRSQALEQQLQITRAQAEAQKALLARLQAMSDAQEQLLTRSRQELQAQEDLLTRVKQQREEQILFRAREQQEQEKQLLTSARQQHELMARARQQQEQDQQMLAMARQQQEIQARTALFGERNNLENPVASEGSSSSQGERSDSASVEISARDGGMRNAAASYPTQSLDVVPSARLSPEESLSNQEKLIDFLTARGGVAEVRNVGEAGAEVRGRVLSVTPAPERSSPLNERVNTRRVVVNRRIQTVQNVDVVEPFTKIERVAFHQPALLQTARVGVAHVPTAVPVHAVHHAPAFVAYRH